jgi:hypothetical protein
MRLVSVLLVLLYVGDSPSRSCVCFVLFVSDLSRLGFSSPTSIVELPMSQVDMSGTLLACSTYFYDILSAVLFIH